MRLVRALSALATLAAVSAPAAADIVPNGDRMFAEVPTMGLFAFPPTKAYMSQFLDKRDPAALDSRPIMLASSLEALRAGPGHAFFAQAPMGAIVAASYTTTVPDGRCRVVGFMVFRGQVAPDVVAAAFNRPGSMMGNMAKEIAQASSEPNRYVFRWNIACPAPRGQGWDIYDPLGALFEAAPRPTSKDAWVKRAEIADRPAAAALHAIVFPPLDANNFSAPTPAAAR